MAHFTTESLVWTFYFEKPRVKVDREKLDNWDQAMEDSFGLAIDEACEKQQIPATKTHRSQILALAVVTRGSELAERVRSAARFYKNSILANEIL